MKEGTNPLQMIVSLNWMADDVIDVSLCTLEAWRDVIDEALKGSWCIFQPKWNNLPLIKFSVARSELFFAHSVSGILMIPLTNSVNTVFNSWCGVWVHLGWWGPWLQVSQSNICSTWPGYQHALELHLLSLGSPAMVDFFPTWLGSCNGDVVLQAKHHLHLYHD